MGDVAEVAEQRALVPRKNFLIQPQRLIVADGGDEVRDVFGFAIARPRNLFGFLVVVLTFGSQR